VGGLDWALGKFGVITGPKSGESSVLVCQNFYFQVSQGSLVMHLRLNGNLYNGYIQNFMGSMTMKIFFREIGIVANDLGKL